MKGSQELIELLREVVNIPEQIILGETVSVDKTKQTAKIKLDDSGNVTYTIRLKAIIDGNETGFVVFPETGAKVLAAKIYNRDDYYMLTCSKAQEVWLRGKANGDLMNISSVTSRLNKIENDINNIKNVFSAWTPVPTDGGAALKTAASTWYGSQLVKTKDSDYNDEKIKH